MGLFAFAPVAQLAEPRGIVGAQLLRRDALGGEMVGQKARQLLHGLICEPPVRVAPPAVILVERAVRLAADGRVVQRHAAALAEQLPRRAQQRVAGDLKEAGEQIDAVYERNDVKLREKEGMQQGKGFLALSGLRSDLDGHVEIVENGVHYDVDYINGQKTGFFLDQKYNRAVVAKLAKGKRVLDCFTHTGAFGLNCALAGAEQVVSVDVSELALEQARRNAELTGVSNVQYLQSDVFDLLTKLSEEKRGQYDLVILDPPAFTKSSATVQSAIRGYKEINLKAMRILPRGGYLATCSCSHFMTDERFRAMLADAARDAQVQLRQIEARQQGPDHPILWNVPETDYLKFYIFQIV